MESGANYDAESKGVASFLGDIECAKELIA